MRNRGRIYAYLPSQTTKTPAPQWVKTKFKDEPDGRRRRRPRPRRRHVSLFSRMISATERRYLFDPPAANLKAVDVSCRGAIRFSFSFRACCCSFFYKRSPAAGNNTIVSADFFSNPRRGWPGRASVVAPVSFSQHLLFPLADSHLILFACSL